MKLRFAAPVSLLCCALLASPSAQSGVRYIYDESGRLVGVIDPAGDAAAYNYDATGNLLSITRSTSTQVKVLEFTPNLGPIGQTVTIYGTGFSATPASNTVTFNNTREGARNRGLNEGSGVTEYRNPRDGSPPHFHPTDNHGQKKPNSRHHQYPKK